MIKLNLVCIVPLVLLVGCASTNVVKSKNEAIKILDKEPLCCATLDQAHAKDLPNTTEKAEEIAFEKGTQARLFDGEKRYFALYKLPAFEKPYSINLYTQSERVSGSSNETQILVPIIETLDESFKVSRSWSNEGLRPRGATGYERTVFINPSSANERYIMIRVGSFKDPIEKNVSTISSNVVPIVFPGGTAYFNTMHGSDSKLRIHSALSGKVYLNVRLDSVVF